MGGKDPGKAGAFIEYGVMVLAILFVISIIVRQI